MLLQLVEPGMTPLPHDHVSDDIPKIAVGIDLGTTNSLVAFSDNRCPRILQNDLDQRFVNGILPSVVFYRQDDQIIVGNMAVKAIEHDPYSIITSVKRTISHQQSSNKQVASYTTFQGEKNSVEISADILKVLKSHAEYVLNTQVNHAVITVPAHFDDTARTLTRDAARVAGLEVLRIINEPTAAALAYGLDKGVQGLYAVYDLGGGTFDFSVLRLQKGVFQVLATGGDTHLGGDDFDDCIISKILNKDDFASTISHSTIKHASSIARSLKERLSYIPSINEIVEINGQQLHVQIDRTHLHDWFKALIDRTLNICNQTICDAKINIRDLQGIIMVGGATRMPSVNQAVKEFFTCPILCDIDPDKAVALGASLQAESLTCGSDTLLLDVNPLSLGIETMGGIVEKIIPRNSTIPLSQTQEFTTFENGQTAILIHVVQGERELVKDCTSLARFEIHGIPPLTAGMACIKVTFTLDADGLLTVSAQEKTTGILQTIEVKPTYGLDTQQLNQMLMDSFEHAEDDINNRVLQQTLISSQQLLKSLEPALQEHGYLIHIDEHQAICQAIIELKSAQVKLDHQLINHAVQLLETASQNFIEKRISYVVQQALVGQHLTNI